MEKSDEIKSALDAVASSQIELVEAGEDLEARRQSLELDQSRHKNLVNAVNDAVVNHPGLSDIQKAAWIEAIDNCADEPGLIENEADRVEEILQRLHEILSHDGTPLFRVELINKNIYISTFYTTGLGLRISDLQSYHTGAAMLARNRGGQASDENIFIDGMMSPASTSAEVKDTILHLRQSAQAAKAGKLNCFIAGSGAIVEFCDYIYIHGSEYFSSAHGPLKEVVISKIGELDVNIEEESEALGAIIAAEKRLAAKYQPEI